MTFNRAKTLLLAAIALCFLISLFQNYVKSYWLYVSYDIGINIILAVSLNLINGYTGQFSLGHAGFMAVGGYTAAVITNQFAGTNPVLAAAIFIGALLAGGLLAAVAGLLVGIPTLRLRGDYLAIVTLGFGEIIRVIFQNMDSVGGARGYTVSHGWTNFFWTFGIAAVTVYIIVALVHSTYGRGFIAVHDDEIAAASVGINPTKYKVTAFVVGAFCGDCRRPVCAFQTIPGAGRFRFHEIHRNCRYGHPWRHGQHAGRHSRCDSLDVAA